MLRRRDAARLAEDLKVWLTSTNARDEDSTYDLVTDSTAGFLGGIQAVESAFG